MNKELKIKKGCEEMARKSLVDNVLNDERYGNLNNGDKSRMIINNSFVCKGFKSFMGMEGYGVNVGIYNLQGKKIAFVIDEGNGGCLNIDYMDEGLVKDKNGDYQKQDGWGKFRLFVEQVLSELPKTTYIDMYGDDEHDFGAYKWDEESLFNVLINRCYEVRDYKKWLRNVCVLEEGNKIVSYKAKSKDLDKEYCRDGVVKSWRDNFSKKGVLLNDLPQEQAFGYFDRYVDVK